MNESSGCFIVTDSNEGNKATVIEVASLSADDCESQRILVKGPSKASFAFIRAIIIALRSGLIFSGSVRVEIDNSFVIGAFTIEGLA